MNTGKIRRARSNVRVQVATPTHPGEKDASPIQIPMSAEKLNVSKRKYAERTRTRAKRHTSGCLFFALLLALICISSIHGASTSSSKKKKKNGEEKHDANDTADRRREVDELL